MEKKYLPNAKENWWKPNSLRFVKNLYTTISLLTQHILHLFLLKDGLEFVLLEFPDFVYTAWIFTLQRI